MNHSKWLNYIRIYLLVIFFMSWGLEAYSQEHTEDEYHLRQFDREQLEELRTSPDYDYSFTRGQGITLWDRFKVWFRNFIINLLNSQGSGTIIRIILYLLIIGAVIFSILKILNTSPSTLLGKPKGKAMPYSVQEENIHEIDFDKEIELAIENNDYRLAIRLYYLRTLKLLTDHDIIKWQTGKTNADYYYELKSVDLRSNFTSLGHMFEYAWYGGLNIEKSVLERAKELYNIINTQIIIK